MSALIALLLPIILIVVVALVIIALVERFSPDPLITVITRWIVFGVVLYLVLPKLLPLLHF